MNRMDKRIASIKKINLQTKKILDDFIYVPSINLYVAREITHFRQNWFECHKELQKKNQRMLIVSEFTEFLKYVVINFPGVYKSIVEIKSPWISEWLDADFRFKKNENKLYINHSHVFNSDGNLIKKKSEILDENTLMKNKNISLDDWIYNAHTSQGLPTKSINFGDLGYAYPRNNNNSAAIFHSGTGKVGLYCSKEPFLKSNCLGVRTAFEKQNKK